MEWRAALRLALLGTTCAMLSASLIHAQLPRRLKNCMPYPPLADEIEEMQVETAVRRPKIHVVKVSFVGANGLPETAKDEVTRRMEKTRFDATAEWLRAFAEIAEQAMQDNGYFKAVVRPQVGVVSSGSMGEQVWVTFHVTEGPQYHLEQIQFANAHVFPVTELRNQVSLRDGDIFDVSKIRLGIDTLTKQYDARGYINFVATPDVHVDDAHRRISVVMRLDEGRRFKVGSVQILGLNQDILNHGLELEMKPGMIFSRKLVEDFYKLNKAILPANASPRENTTVTQDARTHTVAIKFDFRACPQVTP